MMTPPPTPRKTCDPSPSSDEPSNARLPENVRKALSEAVFPAVGAASGALLASSSDAGATWAGITVGAGAGGLVEHLLREHFGFLRCTAPRLFRGKRAILGVALGLAIAIALIVLVDGVMGRDSSLLPSDPIGGQIAGGPITRVALVSSSGEFSTSVNAAVSTVAVVRTRLSNPTVDARPLAGCRMKVALANSSARRIDGTTIIRCNDANPEETVAAFYIESSPDMEVLAAYVPRSTTFWDATIGAGGTGEMLARLPDGVLGDGVVLPSIPSIPEASAGTGQWTKSTRFVNFRIKLSVVPKGTMHDLT